MRDIHNYDDIINLPRPEPKNHPRMPIADRAAQFAPFAALTGFSSVIEETARVTEERPTLDDSEKERINRILTSLARHEKEKPLVKVSYFQEDARKSGGHSLTVECPLGKIDSYQKQLVLENGLKIPFRDIIDLSRGS